VGEGAWGGPRTYGTPTPLPLSSSNEDRRSIDVESEHDEGSELPKRSGSPSEANPVQTPFTYLRFERKKYEDFPFISEQTPESPASTLHKFSDYAEFNLGWRDDMASDSQLPSPRDR